VDSGGRKLLLDPVLSRPKGEIYSASKIRTYIECPAKYYLRYVLGFPFGAGPFVRGESDEERDGDYPAELRGRVVHAVMEEADQMSLTGTAIDDAVRIALARSLPTGPQGTTALARDAAAIVRSVLSSVAWPAIASGQNTRTEFSISAALGEDFITGTIDRLYRDADGTWTVLDYKTDHVSAAEAPQRADVYWPQLSFYAVMVRRLFEAPAVRVRILFTSLPDLVIERRLDGHSLRLAEEEIASVIGKIKAGEFPSSNSPCPGCPFPAGECAVPAPSR
jgi:RecB family exonuclease